MKDIAAARTSATVLVVEVVEVLDHQPDNFRIVACVIMSTCVIFECLELDHTTFSFLLLVSVHSR